MKRAVELFEIERRPSRSRFVDETWTSRSEPDAAFISVAASHWEVVVTRQDGAARVTVRGPETRATIVPVPQGATFFAIQFSPGTFMPRLRPGQLVDRSLDLPQVTPRSFWLDGSRWEVPGPDDGDALVDRLARAGVVVRDPVVPDALRGGVPDLSRRSVERRVALATGLSLGAIARIRRAERAVELLSRGMSPAAVASRAGYADQPHLTRSLKRLMGQTPSRIASSAAGER